jgi:hypothetical protein
MDTLCNRCRWWIQAENDPDFGECRHDPPTPLITQKVEGYMGPWNLKAYWPYSRRNDWCSKWSTRVEMVLSDLDDLDDREETFNDLVENARRKLAE